MPLNRLFSKLKISLLLAGIIFLSGCAHFPHKPAFKHIPWQERQAKLQQNKSWNISGVLSVMYNKKRDYASFEWRQNKDD